MNINSENRICQNCKGNFTIESEDFNFYEKIKVPAPTFCPMCRAERRFVFRNERRLFKVKDAFTNKDIFSLYPMESGRKVVTQEEWHGDSWDAADYARDCDFSRSFFDQLHELEKLVPVAQLRVQLMVNSLYCANATGLKNSYLCFNSTYSEDCMYGNANDYCKDSIDNSHINHSERCYECFWLQKCYQCYFSIVSMDSMNLYFCRSCVGCNDCFGCVGLQKSSYCIYNKQYSKDEYFEEIKKMRLDTISGISVAREKAREFWMTKLYRWSQGIKNLNSEGSYVTECKNAKDCFFVREGENMRYCQYLQVPKNRDCYDCTAWGANMELDYETCLCGDNSYNIRFSYNCWPACRDIEYSINLVNCSNCFGCVGLKKKQYCILNKQYEKEKYFEMVEKIKKHMGEMPHVDKKGNVYKYGEFFPIEFSPFGYNNTFVTQYFKINKEDAINDGYPWYEISRGEYSITKKVSELPDSINDVGSEILKEIIECEKCKNAYRILENELIFYKKENLPLPTMCNDCRFERRIEDRLKLQLHDRKCMCDGRMDESGIYTNTAKHSHGDNPCKEFFKTGYNPNGKEIVYCERCYQQEVY